MTTFLERYRNGEYEQVWLELLTLSDQVRQEPLLTDALAVAHETMYRVRTNIERLVAHLNGLGYQFAFPQRVFVLPRPDIQTQIATFERMIGSLPLSLRAWYEIVGSVCLMGSYPSLATYSDQVSGFAPNRYVDPLVVFPLEAAFEEYEDWKGIGRIGDDDEDEAEPFVIPLAPDDYHKENVSGGSPYGIAVPTMAIDAKLQDEWHNTTFVNYLRICFRWGGFPGWERYVGHPVALLTDLAKDLLPI